MSDISELLEKAKIEVGQATALDALEHIRVNYLGKKGHLTELLKSLSQLSPEERPKMGAAVNQAKREVHGCITEKQKQLQAQKLAEALAEQTIDVTLPGRQATRGHRHPVSITRERINQFFIARGFSVIEGPEVETAHYNFESLNIPPEHPARAMHDTFYFGDGSLLRTHTSPVQIRAMENQVPPFRLIAPGRVYRCDSDVTHTPMFHQVEGLMVDKNISFADLKGILAAFFEYFFEKKVALRFRPSYFPFTEPSAEVDIECTQCDGKGCRACKHTGWLEVLGCGMVHPNVLEAVNIDPEQYTGWAFGMGIDRMAMLKYKIEDLRMLFENDQRFLQQF